MPNAIPTNVRKLMEKNIALAGQRMQTLSSCALTWREALELVAPKEHIQFLFEAAEIAATSSYSSLIVYAPNTLDGAGRPGMTFEFHQNTLGKAPPLMPRYKDWYGCNTPEVAQRVLAHVEYSLACSRMQTSCQHVLEELNENCRDGGQVRALWPAVQYLCDPVEGYSKETNEQLTNWRERYAQIRVPKYLPSISVPFRTLLRETSQWLTQSRLLAPDCHEQAELPVEAGVRPHFGSDFTAPCMNCNFVKLTRE